MSSQRNPGGVAGGPGVAVVSMPAAPAAARGEGAPPSAEPPPAEVRRARGGNSRAPGTRSVAPSLAAVQHASQLPDRRYFRIGEVALLLAVKPYVLRYWETEFPQVRPQKSRSGQRLYRRREVELLLDIRHLLYDRGHTIVGARKALKEAEDARQSGSRAPASTLPEPTSGHSLPPLFDVDDQPLESLFSSQPPPALLQSTPPSAVSLAPAPTPSVSLPPILAAEQLPLNLDKADVQALEEIRDGLRELLSLCKQA